VAGVAECRAVYGVDGGTKDGVPTRGRAEWGARAEEGEEGERRETDGEVDEDERRERAEYESAEAADDRG